MMEFDRRRKEIQATNDPKLRKMLEEKLTEDLRQGMDGAPAQPFRDLPPFFPLRVKAHPPIPDSGFDGIDTPVGILLFSLWKITKAFFRRLRCELYCGHWDCPIHYPQPKGKR